MNLIVDLKFSLAAHVVQILILILIYLQKTVVFCLADSYQACTTCCQGACHELRLHRRSLNRPPSQDLKTLMI